MIEYINSVKNFLKSFDTYIKKYAERPLKDKNHAQMLNLAGDYYEEFQKILQEEGKNSFIEQVSNKFLKFQNLIMDHKTEELTELYNEFDTFIKEEENRAIYEKLVRDIFSTDIEQMYLEDLKREQCQALVDFDIKVNGSVSELTNNLLNAQHMEILNGKVWKETTKSVFSPENEFYSISDLDKLADKIEPNFKKVILNHDKSMKENEQELNSSETKAKKTYQATAYYKKTTDKPLVLYGDNSQELLSKLQKWNEKRPDEQKYYTCYIRTLDPETNRYENSTRYDVETGENITRTYLTIPPMERQEFMDTIGRLKEDGAKFDRINKKFYITPDQNPEKFRKYISNIEKQNPTIPSKGKEGIEQRPSVRKQLEQNKERLKPTELGRQHPGHERGLG